MNHNKSSRKGVIAPKGRDCVLDGPGSIVDPRHVERLYKLEMRRLNFLTVRDVCEMLNVSRLTVIRWIQTGRLPAFKPGQGRSWRIRRSDFNEFVGVE